MLARNLFSRYTNHVRGLICNEDMNMNDEVGDPQERIDDEDVENPDAEVSEEFDPDETVVLSDDQSTDNISDFSVEINF